MAIELDHDIIAGRMFKSASEVFGKILRGHSSDKFYPQNKTWNSKYGSGVDWHFSKRDLLGNAERSLKTYI